MNQCIKQTVWGHDLILNTTGDLFSPKSVDKGTMAMLSAVSLNEKDKVLDLGCGYGVVGIAAAQIVGADHVVMSDNSSSAVSVAKENALLNHVPGIKVILSDGLKNIEDNDFTHILSNPPYHTDFSVAKSFIEDSFKKLIVGGKMFMVTKRKDWYMNKLKSTFGGVKVFEIDGYYVFLAEKRSPLRPIKKKPEGKLSKKLQRKVNKRL